MRRSIKKTVDAGVREKTQKGRSYGMKPESPHSEAWTGAVFQLQSVVGNQAVQRLLESDRPDPFSGPIGKSAGLAGRKVSRMTDANPVTRRTRVQRQPAAEIDEQAQKQAAKKIRDAFTFADGYVSPKFTPYNAKLVAKGREMLAPGGETAKAMAQGRDVTYERELETGGTQSFTEKKSVTVSGDVSKFPVLVTWELWSMLEALKTNNPDDAALLALIGVLEEFWIDHTGYLGTTWVPDVIEISAVLPAKGFAKITSVDLIPRSIVFIDQHALIEPGPYRGLTEADKAKRTVDIVTAHELIHALGYTDAWIHPFLKLFGLSPKLDSDVPGDEYEQEADRVATAIVASMNDEKAGSVRSSQSFSNLKLPGKRFDTQAIGLVDALQKHDGKKLQFRLVPPGLRIQRQSAIRICGQETLQIPVPAVTSTASGTNPLLGLGPFSCQAGLCRVMQGSQAISTTILKQAFRDLRKGVRFSEDLITKIPGYLKRAPASETYEKFIQWMHKTTGVTPAGPTRQPSAAVAAETRAFIDPTSIMSQWSKLGTITPAKGNDPIENWISAVHEQHHRKTILTHPDVDKAYGEIRKIKASLLADPNILAPYDQNLKSKAEKDLPGHIQDESWVIDQEKQIIWKQINGLGGGKLNVIHRAGEEINAAVRAQLLKNVEGLIKAAGIRLLVNKYNQLGALERAYEVQAALLAPKLKQYYEQYAQWFEKTRSFGKEDLKAYCLSWQAEKKALDFIKRCCPGIESSSLKSQPVKGIRRMKINPLEQSEGVLQRLRDENFDDCDRERKKGRRIK